MISVNPGIFRAYDVRGVWRTDFDAEFAQRLGAAVAGYLKAETLIVSRDARMSSDELAYAVIDGVLHTGCRVIDIGTVSSPQFYWAINDLDADGGIMVTASHNPDQHNGFKVNGRRAQVIGGALIRQIYDGYTVNHGAAGALETADVIPGYAAAIRKAVRWEGTHPMQCSVDAPESVRRGIELIARIAPDDRLAARFDADGDRIVFFEDGVQVPAEWIFLLLAEHLKLSPLVHDLRFSKTVTERLAARGARTHISKVGRLNIAEAMKDFSAEFGAELSGHYYFGAFHGMEAPEVVLLQVATLCAKSGKRLHDLIAPYRKYHKSEEMQIPLKDRKAAAKALEYIEKKYPYCKNHRTDGLTVDCWDTPTPDGRHPAGWWFNIRPSNTEPLMRIVIEAKEKDLLEQKLAEVMGALS